MIQTLRAVLGQEAKGVLVVVIRAGLAGGIEPRKKEEEQ
jgi:hypothetical protein